METTRTSIEEGRIERVKINVERVKINAATFDRYYGLEGITENGEKCLIKHHPHGLVDRDAICRGIALSPRARERPELEEFICSGYKFASFLTDDIPKGFKEGGYDRDKMFLICLWTRQMQSEIGRYQMPTVKNFKRYYDIGWMYPLFWTLFQDEVSARIIHAEDKYDQFKPRTYQEDGCSYKEKILEEYKNWVLKLNGYENGHKERSAASTAPLVLVVDERINDLCLGEITTIISNMGLKHLMVKPVKNF